MANKDYLEIDGRRIAVSNLDKVLYTGGRFTKARVIDYYIRISRYLLPHVKNRPVTLKRFPNGIYGEFFYEKDAPSFTPDWVRTFPVARRETNGADIQYIVIDDLPTLVWLANLANLEIHPFLHRLPHLDRPQWIVFDLDPGAGADILNCARVAFLLRDLLLELKLESLVKVSGSKGLQLYVPLNTPATYAQTQPFAKAIAELLAHTYPKLIVAKMAKVLRSRRVLIDWSQNDDYKTTVSVYSLRATYHRPYVSMPVEWSGLQQALDQRDAEKLYFKPEAALERVTARGDLFKEVLTKKQKLPSEVASVTRPNASTRGKRRSGPTVQEPLRQPGKSVRRSRQGGRRRFLIDQTRGQKNLLLEMNDTVRTWRLLGALSNVARQKSAARAGSAKSIGEFEKRAQAGPRKQWDAGSYDLIEGSYENGFLRLYLIGKKINGEWIISRSGDGDWMIERAR